MDASSQREVTLNGWTPVPIDAGKLFNGQPCRFAPSPIKTQELKFPWDDPVVVRVREYAKEKLPQQTFSHSMRVYYYASAIVQQQFPDFARTLSPSTLAITALLHDIGTTDENMAATRMSFEFYGGIQALRILEASGASQDQADAVCEAIIRHQDIGTEGQITFLGQIIQLATIFDNVSEHPHLNNIKDMVHVETREDVIAAFPRTGWLACFAKTLQKEVGSKPWCHTTHIPNFEEKIRGNELMSQYE